MALIEFTENLITDLHKANSVLHLLDFLLVFNFAHIMYLLIFHIVQQGTLLQKLALTSIIMCSLFVIPGVILGLLVFRKFRHRRV